MKCEECGKAIIDEEMSDRWKIEIVDINAQPTILRACPNVEVMTDYVQKTIDELNLARTVRSSVLEMFVIKFYVLGENLKLIKHVRGNITDETTTGGLS